MNYYLEVGMMNKVNGNESSLFIYLLTRANNVGWKNPFPVATQNVISVLGITNATLVNVRNRLKEKGLIDFREGKRGVEAPQYCLPVRTADGKIYFPWDSPIEGSQVSEPAVKAVSTVKSEPPVSTSVPIQPKPVAVKNDFESLRKQAIEQAELIRAEVQKQTVDLESTALKQYTDVDEVKKVINDILDGWIKGGQVHNTNGRFDLGAAMRHLWNTVPFRFEAKRRNKQNQNKQNNYTQNFNNQYEDKYARRRGTEPLDIPNEEFDTSF